MVEVLLFSSKKLFACIDNPDLQNKDGMVVRQYYNGKEFNDRHPFDGRQNKFLDATLVFQGVVNEFLITTQEQDPDGLAEELLEAEKVL